VAQAVLYLKGPYLDSSIVKKIKSKQTQTRNDKSCDKVML